MFEFARNGTRVSVSADALSCAFRTCARNHTPCVCCRYKDFGFLCLISRMLIRRMVLPGAGYGAMIATSPMEVCCYWTFLSCYAECGTETGYAAMRCAVLTPAMLLRDVRYLQRLCFYALCGTYMRHAATSSERMLRLH